MFPSGILSRGLWHNPWNGGTLLVIEDFFQPTDYSISIACLFHKNGSKNICTHRQLPIQGPITKLLVLLPLFWQGKGEKGAALVSGSSSDLRKERKGKEHEIPTWNGVLKSPMHFTCSCCPGVPSPPNTQLRS